MSAVLLLVVFFVFFGGAVALWVWTLVDAIRREDDEFRTGDRTIWVLIIALTGAIGSAIYLATGRPRG